MQATSLVRWTVALPRRRGTAGARLTRDVMRKLLVVEDDPDGREVLSELFRIRGWEVTDVANVEGALQALRTDHFDVVISDENVDGRSGSEMLREAQRQGLLADVGALVYTADDHTVEVPSGVRVLLKPLGIDALVDEAQHAAPWAR